MKNNEFLTAEWRKLVLLNYVIDPSILRPFVPARTEIDLFEGRCYVSLVGFMFVNTRVRGWSIPFHRDFEEVNLRFYVRFYEGEELRRGVVFIKEIVPRRAISLVANAIYGENYETMQMEHSWILNDGTINVSYRWKKSGWNGIVVSANSTASAVIQGSEEDFITNHYWGYTRLSDRLTSEYEVTHPVWEVYPVQRFNADVNFRDVYGKRFEALRSTEPHSVFLAEGSAISVRNGRRFQ
jgi:uncharacterized protein